MKKKILRILIMAMCIFWYTGIYTYADELSDSKTEVTSDESTDDADETIDNEQTDDIGEPIVDESIEKNDESTNNELIGDMDEVNKGTDITEEDEQLKETSVNNQQDNAENDLFVDKINRSRITTTDYVQGYVERCYQYILGRSVDASGLNTWTQKILSGYGGAEIVKDLIISDEFVAQEKNDEEVVEILYQTMLGRKADATRKANWLDVLSEGVSY